MSIGLNELWDVSDAILGTTFFGQQAPGSFGKFDKALVSMFCVAAGMGWPEVNQCKFLHAHY